MATYIVAGSKPWSKSVFEKTIRNYPGNWHFVGDPSGLQPNWVHSLAPRYIFFLHWSWKVAPELIESYECICFHMTDLPFGRGGSPLQNLIFRGHRRTKLTAFRMVHQFDAGPVYLKDDLSLEGTGEEIYIRASEMAAKMILRIVEDENQPIPQVGEPVAFQRRTPAQSEIPVCQDLMHLFDFIRMLDADGYPKAYLVHNGYRYEFSRPALYDGRLVADVRIELNREEPKK